jgi:hypothetical protein
LDLIDRDGSIHDLDQHPVSGKDTTLGMVLCELMHRLQSAEAAIHKAVKAPGNSKSILEDHIREYPNQA